MGLGNPDNGYEYQYHLVQRNIDDDSCYQCDNVEGDSDDGCFYHYNHVQGNPDDGCDYQYNLLQRNPDDGCSYQCNHTMGFSMNDTTIRYMRFPMASLKLWTRKYGTKTRLCPFINDAIA
ncbi:hypothetical protein PoB_005898800 [Plakobranchus ocellatus]|uniref:Uncharacterized protein n=1 Tax=Plakobranchus ocellatus TaxID=259542 RepID=A0AAV4CKF5_9GAST|nr:hypothetical protein PoB_005898800 [Plakobranchus ocellatus]